MTAKEQTRLVKHIAAAFAAEIVSKIESGRIPANWDGHELSKLLADKATANASGSLITREPRSARARDYHNTVIVNNL